MTQRFIPGLIPLLGVIAISLTACGGGGDGGGASDNGNGTPPPPPTTHPLGSRVLPGSTVTVTSETTISPGQPASILITAPDLPAGTAMAAAIGVDRDTATPATVIPLASNQWRATLTLPDPLPSGTCVLVTLTLADGSLLESGYDFVLTQ